jgi:hypothetical protein
VGSQADGQGGKAAVDAPLQGQRADCGVEVGEGAQAVQVDRGLGSAESSGPTSG